MSGYIDRYVLFTALKVGYRGVRQPFATVAVSLEHCANQLFVLPGKTTKEDSDPVALMRQEQSLNGTTEARRFVEPERALTIGRALAQFYEVRINRSKPEMPNATKPAKPTNG